MFSSFQFNLPERHTTIKPKIGSFSDTIFDIAQLESDRKYYI